MTAQELLEHLEVVRPRAKGRWIARCPAHADKHPSLAIAEGESGLLIRCWAGCRIQDITAALGLTLRELFYDHEQVPDDWRRTRQQRMIERENRENQEYVRGLILDARREAEWLLVSARNPGLVGWNDAELHTALAVIADAHEVLYAEKVEHGDEPF
jgi:hypothetical protein